MTRSRAFKKVSDYSFSVCDNDKTGEVAKTELYAGVLLVHLKLAKYAGPAACFVSALCAQACDPTEELPHEQYLSSTRPVILFFLSLSALRQFFDLPIDEYYTCSSKTNEIVTPDAL